LRLRTANGNTVFYTYDGELVMYQPTGGGDVLRANIGSVSIFSPSKDAGLSITKDATYLSSVGMVQLNAGSGRSYFKLDEIDTRLIAYTNLYIKSYGQMTVDSNVILIPSIPSSGKFPMNFLTQFPESGQVVKSSIEDAKWMLSINGIYPLANGIRYSSGVSDGLGIEMESGIMRYTTLATDLEIYMPKLPRAVEGGVYSVMLAGENDGALKKASLEEIGERIGFSDHISEDLLRWQSILDDRSKQWEAIEALQNKTTSGSTPEDMLTTSETDAGYIVANALGGVVTYKTKAVLGLLLGSGTLTINGVQEDKGLTLIGGVSGTKVVKDGDKVQSSNMESLTFTPYIAA
jgi:hypothetical protein